MTLVLSTPYKKPQVSIPPFPYYAASTYLNASQYNTSAKLIALATGQMTSDTTGDTFTLDTGTTKYGYFFSPVSNGAIQFTEINSNLLGGWDGATWADGDIGSTNGPATISLDFGAGPSDWYVYRTDFAGIGIVTWKLRYLS